MDMLKLQAPALKQAIYQQADIRKNFDIMFADDTTLLIKDKDKENLYKKANKQLNKFNYWLNKNALVINLEEAKYIVLNRSVKKILQKI